MTNFGFSQGLDDKMIRMIRSTAYTFGFLVVCLAAASIARSGVTSRWVTADMAQHSISARASMRRWFCSGVRMRSCLMKVRRLQCHRSG